MKKGIILAFEQFPMKSRFLIILSAVALLVLIAVQYIFITETYRTKQEQFDVKFGDLVREGMVKFNSQEFNFNFDSVLFKLDNMAVEYQFSSTDSLIQSPGESFFEVLDHFREPELFIKNYIHEAGVDPDFSFHYQLNELIMLDLGYEQKVYLGSVKLPSSPGGALLAGSYTHQRNFFRISYEIYINFTNRSQMILKEMRMILILDILTLALVFIVFYMTLRNMLKQKRLSEMKTDFINNMTHELKTPLSTISVASSSLGNPTIIKQQDKVEELSGLIKRQNRHLSELIDRILDINIWEKDQVKLKPEHVPLELWIREVVNAFLLKRDKDSPEIRLNIHLIHETQLLDEVHMSTVVNNLLTNAKKYGNNPCIIDLEVYNLDESLILEVKDNGPGIRREDMKHLFEKFFRGEESKERVIKGLGLGLYYVKQIVEAHKGSITVQSALKKGAKFTIQIPIENGLTAG
jgi:signal transduction histidine kinase